MCVAGGFSHLLSSIKSARNHERKECLTNDNSALPTEGVLKHIDGSQPILNNKSEFHSLTNKIIHRINDNCNRNNVTQSVILCFDKGTVDHKNRKNFILNQKHNKFNVNGSKLQTANKCDRFNVFDYDQNFHKDFNEIHKLKNELSKHLMITDDTEETCENMKLHIRNNADVPDGCISNNKLTLIKGFEHKPIDEVSNAIHVIPTNLNIHKIDGLSKSHENARSGFVRKCSHEMTKDIRTTRTNYVLRQTCQSKGSGVASDAHRLHEKHLEGIKSVHEKSKYATNIQIIPNIVINESPTDLSVKMIIGINDGEETLSGK